MRTTEGLQPASQPDHGGQDKDPQPAGDHFQDPTPTTPFPLAEISTQLAQGDGAYSETAHTRPAAGTFSRLMENRAFRRAGAITAGLAVVGAAAVGVMLSGKRTVEGTPMAAGREAPPIPGVNPDGSQSSESKEASVVNLCNKISLQDIGEWAFGSGSVIPPQEGLAPDDAITCNGEVPTNTDVPMENFTASGEWDFPQTGMNSFPVDHISIWVVKDRLPDGSSHFERQRRTFSEDPQTQIIGGTEVTTLSGGGTTLAKVPQPGGSTMDVSFSIVLPMGTGGDSELPYPAFHRGEREALPTLLPRLELVE